RLSATMQNGGKTNCLVDATGNYTLTGLTAGTWELQAYGNGTIYEMTPASLTIANVDVTQNITITQGADLNVTLNTKETNPAFRAYLSLEKKNGDSWST
ncbi:MAG: hypothetical protein RR336_12255, partial [Oscillospiraceae bacterium]